MPGGFHPFHAGHYSLYQQAKKKFPDAEIYVAASNDQSERPFPFTLKEKLAKIAGVDPGKFIQVKSPFRPKEITDHYDPKKDILIFVRSNKDRDEEPKPGVVKKDGSPGYLQYWEGEDKAQPFSKHAYMEYLDTVKFGPGITSATQIRNMWPTMDDAGKINLIANLYPTIAKNKKLVQNVVKMFDNVMGSQGVAESQTAKAGIVQTEVYGTKAYHAKCMEPNCDWESKRYDRIQQAQAAAKKHGEQHFNKKDVAENTLFTNEDIKSLYQKIKPLISEASPDQKEKLYKLIEQAKKRFTANDTVEIIPESTDYLPEK